MKIDLDWRTDGNGRSWRSIYWADVEVGQIECQRDGYRAVIDGKPVGPWFDRLWEAVARFKQRSEANDGTIL